jgi:hypothetical protein
MIDNAFRRKQVLQRMHEITRRQLGIMDTEFPLVVFHPDEIPYGLKRSFNGRQGWNGGCSPEVPLMFINLSLIRDEEELENTIEHEFVHYRFGYSKHGVKFDRNLYAIKRGDVFDNVKMRWRIGGDKHVQYYFVVDRRIGRGNRWDHQKKEKEKE